MAALIRPKLKNVIKISLLAFCLLSFSSVWAQKESTDYWPREIETTQGVVCFSDADRVCYGGLL